MAFQASKHCSGLQLRRTTGLQTQKVFLKCKPAPIAVSRGLIRVLASSEENPIVVESPSSSISEQDPVVGSSEEVQPKVEEPEVTFYEGNGGSAVELIMNILLSTTLIWAPLTISAIGRRLWIKYRFTNKRIVVMNTSPLFKNEVQISYDKVKEVRAAGKAFGLWGDMVVYLKDNSRLELIGMENWQELKDHIEKCTFTIKA